MLTIFLTIENPTFFCINKILYYNQLMKHLIQQFFSLFHKTSILNQEKDILKWLRAHDREYDNNLKNNAYEFIDIWDSSNQSLLNELIKKDNLSSDYFEKLKNEGHQFIINCQSDVNMYVKDMSYIPIQFYHIEGDFKCSINQLQSLKGCPQQVHGSFSCDGNQLTSLEYCPQSIGGHFYCDHNQLTSLKFCPQSIGGHFYCEHNQLTSLKDCPQSIGATFSCSHNQLTSLNYCPQSIGGHFLCAHNQLTSLKYGPQSVGATFSCDHNQLTSLKYCPQSIGGHFYCDHNQLTSLKYCPQSIGDHFYCYNNQLTSLDHFPEKINGDIYLANNQKLLKYKKELHDKHINHMTDDDFCNQRDFQFWYQFYLQEKIIKENTQIMDNLNLDDKIEKNHSIKPRIMKV